MLEKSNEMQESQLVQAKDTELANTQQQLTMMVILENHMF